MSDPSLTNSPTVAAYRARTKGSAALAERARGVFPSGLVHDARRLDPYPIYVERAAGPRKWDIDGNEYVDYYGGHGALLLGHCHPEVMKAVHQRLDLGTHFGACHELEIRWGELVRKLVPCAERVRFFSSGSEANMMALRLARGFTGRDKVVRFKGHFHGWQDHAAFGYDNHFDGTATPGLLTGIAESVLLAPPDDIEATCALLRAHADDIAVVMLEPTGGSFGVLPMGRDFVSRLREVTRELGILLMFDEVVTGFRVSPGGAQGHYGITPDLATFAKILAGGLPGGCVAGPKAILDLLDFDEMQRQGKEKIQHQGTFNANPVSAAAGIVTLEIIGGPTDPCARASRTAEQIRQGVNRVFGEEDVPWAAYGEHSAVYVYTNPDNRDIDPLAFDAYGESHDALKRSGKHRAANRFRLALLVHGVDMSGKPGGIVSATHGEAEVAQTVEAFRQACRMLKAEGELRRGAVSA
ncbi:MAG: aminotransferase class III-fold pyridoxal phosphate-dependent enzyme [Ectothiorhodospiraceae bacterium]|nr:aminotransferase class III-fold pyridoxal phosphate-dependent enzyme [Chromatiales bacterium]MCP5156719.1 aminotransferase class III-fold pyridoxal phosphate-dependent enzyme [Ectothiorhodospiraceae bacterium]